MPSRMSATSSDPQLHSNPTFGAPELEGIAIPACSGCWSALIAASKAGRFLLHALGMLPLYHCTGINRSPL